MLKQSSAATESVPEDHLCMNKRQLMSGFFAGGAARVAGKGRGTAGAARALAKRRAKKRTRERKTASEHKSHSQRFLVSNAAPRKRGVQCEITPGAA